MFWPAKESLVTGSTITSVLPDVVFPMATDGESRAKSINSRPFTGRLTIWRSVITVLSCGKSGDYVLTGVRALHGPRKPGGSVGNRHIRFGHAAARSVHHPARECGVHGLAEGRGRISDGKTKHQSSKE